MESPSEVRRRNRILNKQTRRKERAEKVERERRSTAGEEDLDDPSLLLQPPRPLKKPRKNKPRKPFAEEDIVEGFAIVAYKSFDDLTRALNLAEGESKERNVCGAAQLLKGSQEGGDNKGSGGGGCEKDKEKKNPTKPPRTKSSTIKNKLKENNMVNKSPGTDNRCSLATGVSPPPPLKKARTNGPSLKEPLRKINCETDDMTGDKVSDGFSDLFAPQRKDSSPHILLDNLHSLNEEKPIIDPGEKNHINHELTSASSTGRGAAVSPPETETLEPILPIPYLTGPPSSLNSNPGDVNGHANNSQSQSRSKSTTPPTTSSSSSSSQHQVLKSENFTPKLTRVTQQQTTLFTPYATTAITRVGVLPTTQSSFPDSELQISSRRSDHSPNTTAIPLQLHNNSNNTRQSPCDFTLSGSQIHHSASTSPAVEKTGNGSSGGHHKFKSASGSSSASGIYNRVPHHGSSGSGKVTPTASSKSTAFGSIARLLDTPNSASASTSSRNNSSSSQRASHSHSPNTLPIPTRDQNNSLAPSAAQSFASRSLSPRGHSPSRERDSYSSNVSTLSRTSVTPVSGSSSQQHLPPNLSPIQSLSYAKAASWLSSVPPGLSPVPRPTPPPQGQLNYPGQGGPPSLPLTSTHSPQSPYSGLVSGGPHGLLPPHSSTNAMFAPPILPLSSILPHPSSQSSPFCPSAESIFHGASSNEMVRRDLESRFLSVDRSHGGGGGGAGSSSFLGGGRPGEISHPHHTGIPGVNQHLQQQQQQQQHNPGPGPPNSTHPPHPSSLFPPPMFKDMPKVGLDSPFYRGALGMSYPFNGMLQPPNIATPFTPPSQLTTFTPKKSGRWNAMHVRIAWEIYQHQQKGGEGKGGGVPGKNPLNPSTSQPSSSLTAAPTSSAAAMAANSEFLRQQNNQVFPGLNRPPDPVGPPPFASPLLSPHLPPSHRPPFDSPHPLFIHSGHLGEAEALAAYYSSYLTSCANAGLNSFMTGPPLSRYGGFGGLPSFAGLNSLGSSLLSRDLSSLASLGTAQDQWLRMQRLQAPLYPPIGPPGMNWPVQTRPERETRTPTEPPPRRHKEERQEKRESSSHGDSKGGRDSSPFRDRSPIRSSRTTPLENGDTDSRSSRSSDSHSTVQPPLSKFARLKDEANGNGERNKTPTLRDDRERDRDRDRDRETFLHGGPGPLNENNKSGPNFLPAGHTSRGMFHPASSMTTPITSGWDSFPGISSSGPRMSSADSFRLTLLQLSEREREFSRIQQHQQLRPPLFGNGPPFMNLPLGMGGLGMLPGVGGGATSNSNGSNGNGGNGNPNLNPKGAPIPHINPSMAAASLSAISHGHHHSSQNGPNSPHKTDVESRSTKEESHSSSR